VNWRTHAVEQPNHIGAIGDHLGLSFLE